MVTATAPEPPSASIGAARDLFPEIRALAPRIEQERRLPPELIARMTEAGLFRLMVPRALGGLEADVRTTLEVIEEVSRADGSAGWIVMIGAASGVLSAYLADEAARRIFVPETLIGGVAAPLGRAQVTEGGYRVSGRWPFASGCLHTSWVVGGGIVFEGGAPRRCNGVPEARMFLFPIDAVQIHDTWQVSGLRGSGSHDMEVSDILVPHERSVSFFTDRPRHPGPLYGFPVFSLLSIGVAATTLGIARAAVDEFIRLSREKTPLGAKAPLATRAVVQAKVAEAEAVLRSARAFLYDAVERCWRLCEAGQEAPVALRAELRLAGAHAATSAARAVDIAYHAAGATSIYDASPLQRFFRDVHVATQHSMVGPDMYELTGRLFLGIETDTSRL